MCFVSCLNHSLFPFHASHPFPLSLLSPIPCLPSLPSSSASVSTFPVAPTSTPTGRKSRGSASLPAWIHGCSRPRPIHDPYTNTPNGETTLCMTNSIEYYKTNSALGALRTFPFHPNCSNCSNAGRSFASVFSKSPDGCNEGILLEWSQ